MYRQLQESSDHEDLTVDETSASYSLSSWDYDGGSPLEEEGLKSMVKEWKKVTQDAASLGEGVVRRYHAVVSRLESENQEIRKNLAVKETESRELTKNLALREKERKDLMKKLALKESKLAEAEKKCVKLSLCYEQEQQRRCAAEAEKTKQKARADSADKRTKELESKVKTLERTLQQEKEAASELQKKRAALYSELQMLEGGGHSEASPVIHELGRVSPTTNSTKRSRRDQLCDPKWDQCLRPHFSEVVKVLCLDKLLPLLYSSGLIDRDEHRLLSNDKETEKKRVEVLLLDVLMKKGPGTFDKLCGILRKVPGQEHIVEIISPLAVGHV